MAIRDAKPEDAVAACEAVRQTARRFYLSNGYVETGAATPKFGMRSGYRMSKALA
jgi:hypothetical protein